jgi:hypothetical protein
VIRRNDRGMLRGRNVKELTKGMTSKRVNWCDQPK